MLDANIHRYIHVMGTIRKNRKGLSKEIVNAKLKHGEICFTENEYGIKLLIGKRRRTFLCFPQNMEAK